MTTNHPTPPYHQLRTHDHHNHYHPHWNHQHYKNNIHTNPNGTRWTHGDTWYQTYPNQKLPEPHGHLQHKVNNDNWHGDNFHHNPDILTLGCSITAGIGLPHNYTWPTIIATLNNLKINNIAIPGTAPTQILNTTLHHTQKYGWPKQIYLLTPPLDRYWGPTPQQHNNQTEWPTTHTHYNHQTNQYQHGNTPHQHTDITTNKPTTIPTDIIAHHNLLAIENLATLTKTLNIPLKIGTWNQHTSRQLQTINYPENAPFHQYTNKPPHQRHHTPQEQNHNYPLPDQLFPLGSRTNCCHLKPQNKHQNHYWDTANDKHPNHPNPHPGLHYHIHLAEYLHQQPITNKQLKQIKPWNHNQTK